MNRYPETCRCAYCEKIIDGDEARMSRQVMIEEEDDDLVFRIVTLLGKNNNKPTIFCESGMIESAACLDCIIAAYPAAGVPTSRHYFLDARASRHRFLL